MEYLHIRPEGTYVDCTVGGGGHSFGVASRLTTGRLLSLDRDGDALAAAGRRLACFGERVRLVKADFREVGKVLDQYGLSQIDGALLDLGVSSYQLDTAERGFSYLKDAPLDMRMDRTQSLDAERVINTYDQSALTRIFRDYGEERFAALIARRICAVRQSSPIRTTGELSALIQAAIPARCRERDHHPARRVFQAVRMEVNGELSAIRPALTALTERLTVGGRLAVITFHSLEDRAVKECFAAFAKGCDCPPDFPVCVCGKRPSVRLLTRKPILPDPKELAENSRAHSAKLRCVEKLDGAQAEGANQTQ